MGKGTEYAPNLDPAQITVQAGGFDAIFNALTYGTVDEKTGVWTYGPMLAESWEQPNPTTLVFKLRKGVVFHDGSAWNAEVAKWNIDRKLTHPKSAAKDDYAIIKTASVVDEYTLRLELKGPPGGLIGKLSDVAIGWRSFMYSKTAAEKNGDDWVNLNPVGTGPMQFVEWKTGDHLTVKKWDKSWEKGVDGQPLPYVDQIVYRYVKDAAVRSAEMRAGTLDVIDQLAPQDHAAIKADPKLQINEASWAPVTQYLFFNMPKPPFAKNTKLRQAMLYALDRENIAKVMGLGTGRPMYYYWAPGVLGYDETLPKYTYDVAKAKQLLAESGFDTKTEIKTSTFGDDNQKASVVVKSMWDAIGLKTIIDMMDRTAAVALWQTGGFELGLSSRSSGVQDPDDYSFRVITGGVFNFAHWENSEMDKCMEEGRMTAETNKRAEIYKRCQKILYEDAPYGETWGYMRNTVTNKALKGWEYHVSQDIRLSRAWLDK
jgi:peptide/nickel transport system substrate-binding protein